MESHNKQFFRGSRSELQMTGGKSGKLGPRSQVAKNMLEMDQMIRLPYRVGRLNLGMRLLKVNGIFVARQ